MLQLFTGSSGEASVGRASPGSASDSSGRSSGVRDPLCPRS